VPSARAPSRLALPASLKRPDSWPSAAHTPLCLVERQLIFELDLARPRPFFTSWPCFEPAKWPPARLAGRGRRAPAGDLPAKGRSTGRPEVLTLGSRARRRHALQEGRDRRAQGRCRTAPGRERRAASVLVPRSHTLEAISGGRVSRQGNSNRVRRVTSTELFAERVLTFVGVRRPAAGALTASREPTTPDEALWTGSDS
jgi:hypothetical protein